MMIMMITLKNHRWIMTITDDWFCQKLVTTNCFIHIHSWYSYQIHTLRYLLLDLLPAWGTLGSTWFSFTNIHESQDGEGEGYFLNFSLPLLLTPQTLRDYLGDYYRLHSSWLVSNQETLVPKYTLLTTKLHTFKTVLGFTNWPGDEGFLGFCEKKSWVLLLLGFLSRSWRFWS